MSILHMSLGAAEPETAARIIAEVLRGPALSFPPCPGAWIAFADTDDGTAIEVYPNTTRVEAGAETIAFTTGAAETGPALAHVAVATGRPAEEVVEIGTRAGWLTRICNRGPFECVELWVENRVLIEVLDPAMQRDYRAGMTAENWRAMFDL
ncbi:hypothetical protein V8J82_10485 [Gymnodinialimonas sp. 2305UL16-5]|uniref:hypothetical protein n=1 Tax=Gymnodinialimonas mytili TaxID=3126503 RepID=UPI00309B5ED4